MSTDKPSGKKKKKFSRRKFFKRAGIVLGGTVVAMYLGRKPFRRFVYKTAAEMELPSGVFDFDIDVWLEVLADNTILLKSPKVEMGQGIFTGFAMMVAEEMEVPIEQVRVQPGNSTTTANDLAGTGGSSSTYSLYTPIREVAATMREMLRLAAAKQWGVDASIVTTNAGQMSSGDKNMSYADIVKATTDWTVPDTPALKARSDFKYIGQEMKRVDLRPKVTGQALYAIDAELPGMVYATILYAPYIGGTLKSIEADKAKAVKGVLEVVEEDGLVAVVASNRYAAEMGRQALNAQWEVTKQWQQEDLESMITVGNGDEVNVQKEGKAPSLLADAASEQLFEQEYRLPLGAHAHLEPNGSIAHWQEGKLKIIIGTQVPGNLLDELTAGTGVSKKNIEVQNSFLGGGFGRRYFRNNAVDAAKISKAIGGKPVHVFKSREDEFQNGYLRPNTHHQLQAVVGTDGKVTAIRHDQATGDMMLKAMPVPGAKTVLGADIISAGHGARLIYGFPNRYATIWQQYLPFQTGIWRGVGQFPNNFAIECFMDELALHLKKDPIAFRLDYLQDKEPIIQRFKKTLEVLAVEGGWNSPKAAGTGRGIAIAEDRNSISGAIIEVQVVDEQIKVTKVTQVIDPGMIINPDGVRMQVEGATMMALSATLYEEVRVKDSQFSVTNYHQYPMASLRDTPEIKVVMIEGAEKPYGVGEPPIAPVAPAIANAVFDLTGQRLRSLPLRLKS